MHPTHPAQARFLSSPSKNKTSHVDGFDSMLGLRRKEDDAHSVRTPTGETRRTHTLVVAECDNVEHLI